MKQIRVVVAGAAGRMGRALVRAIARSDDIVLSGALGASGGAYLGQDAGTFAGVAPAGISITDNVVATFANTDVLIDFTRAKTSAALAALCAEARKPMAIGTTGFSEDDEALIRAAARRTAIVKSGNMSLGVNVLAALVKQAAKALPDFDIEIVEMHHRIKADAPSGTALLLGEAAASAREVSLKDTATKARAEKSALRRTGEIGFASLRGGTGERLVLRHSAEDRAIFADGALAAARWVVGKPPGLYAMADVLGLNEN
jgi:4-hydroxy-tetrahydrodipicolinate reductase